MNIATPRSFGSVLSAAVVFLSVPCAMAQSMPPSFADIISNAEREGKIVFLTTFPGSELTIPRAFGEAYPKIRVEAQRMQTIDATPRLDQEAAVDADATDVALISGEDWFLAKKAQGKLTAPVGPEVQRWSATNYFKGDYIIAAVLPMVFGFNTSKITPFTDWNGFEAPALRGKYAVCDTEGAPIIAYNDWIRTTFSNQFLKNIMQDQKPVVFRSTSAAAQALAAGEIDAALCMTPGAIEPLIKQGAPAAFTIPKPGFGLVGALGITSWSKRPNAAQVFVNWLMTDDGQNALIAGVGTAASPVGARASAAIDIDSIDAWDASKYDPSKYNQLRGEFTRLLRAR